MGKVPLQGFVWFCSFFGNAGRAATTAAHSLTHSLVSE